MDQKLLTCWLVETACCLGSQWREEEGQGRSGHSVSPSIRCDWTVAIHSLAERSLLPTDWLDCQPG